MQKKAQGLPLSTIVIAALVLLVLVVLAIIFMGRMGKTGQVINTCESYGGSCVASVADCTATGGKTTSAYQCDMNGNGKYGEPDDGVCCIKI